MFKILYFSHLIVFLQGEKDTDSKNDREISRNRPHERCHQR